MLRQDNIGDIYSNFRETFEKIWDIYKTIETDDDKYDKNKLLSIIKNYEDNISLLKYTIKFLELSRLNDYVELLCIVGESYFNLAELTDIPNQEYQYIKQAKSAYQLAYKPLNNLPSFRLTSQISDQKKLVSYCLDKVKYYRADFYYEEYLRATKSSNDFEKNKQLLRKSEKLYKKFHTLLEKEYNISAIRKQLDISDDFINSIKNKLEMIKQINKNNQKRKISDTELIEDSNLPVTTENKIDDSNQSLLKKIIHHDAKLLFDFSIQSNTRLNNHKKPKMTNQVHSDNINWSFSFFKDNASIVFNEGYIKSILEQLDIFIKNNLSNYSYMQESKLTMCKLEKVAHSFLIIISRMINQNKSISTYCGIPICLLLTGYYFKCAAKCLYGNVQINNRLKFYVQNYFQPFKVVIPAHLQFSLLEFNGIFDYLEKNNLLNSEVMNTEVLLRHGFKFLEKYSSKIELNDIKDNLLENINKINNLAIDNPYTEKTLKMT